MSHDITSEDGLVLAGKGAWHGLGTVVQNAPTVQGALQLAGLDWTVQRHPLFIQPGPGENLATVPDRVALLRSDTGRVLEVVGKGYEVLQNADLADLIDGLSREGEVARAESAGSLRQGRRVFFLIRRGMFALNTPGRSGKDEIAEYLLFSNTHDGTGALGIIPTTVRVVCANTLRAAESGFSIRHSQSMGARIEAAKMALRDADQGVARMRETIVQLARVPMDDEYRRLFFLKVYEAANGAIPAKPTTEAEERARARAISTVSEWVANLDSPRNTGTGTEGTLWHALNAATEWSDHKRTVRRTGTEDTERAARAQSNLFGTSASFKGKALAEAVKLAQ